MRILSQGAYRTWQAWQALWAGPLPPVARHEVSGLLTAEQMALFESQGHAGQQHSYRVMRTLAQAGYDQDCLLVAALLHDLGKYQARYTWLDRVKVVLTERFAPALAAKWAAGRQNWWTRAYVVKASHPEWGALALAETGASDMSVALVRRHQEQLVDRNTDDKENELLALLQWADNQN